MFITLDFIQKYIKRAKHIRIDGKALNDMPKNHCVALAAYLHDMYMVVRKHMPCDELFEEEK